MPSKAAPPDSVLQSGLIPSKEEGDLLKSTDYPDRQAAQDGADTPRSASKQRQELHKRSHSQREAAGAGWRSEVQDIPQQRSFIGKTI